MSLYNLSSDVVGVGVGLKKKRQKNACAELLLFLCGTEHHNCSDIGVFYFLVLHLNSTGKILP